MKRLRTRLGSHTELDSGFSLIEVIMAIIVIGIISTASLSIYLQSMNSASTQQRREIAITIANQTMENVNVWSTATDPDSGVSALYAGRTEPRVRQFWIANELVSGVSQTYPMWDPRLPAVPALPEALAIKPSDPVVRSGTEFTVGTLIGTCYQLKTGGDCTRIPGWSGYPLAISAANAALYTPLTRVIVIVRWTAGGVCDSGGCMYQTATLIDLNSDLEWNTP